MIGCGWFCCDAGQATSISTKRPSASFALQVDAKSHSRYWTVVIERSPTTHLPDTQQHSSQGLQGYQNYFDAYLISFNDRVATGFLTFFSNYG